MVEKSFVRTERGVVAYVTFTLPEGLWADSISLVGDFNGWDTAAHPMRRDHQGRWTITIELEPNRTYEFLYYCDGEWLTDSHADGYVENQYGGHNCLVQTHLPPEWVAT